MALTKAHNRMIEGSPVNVKDYGATGDGTTDDTVAIKAAIAAVKVSGKSLFIPTGTYRVTETLVMDFDDFLLYGEGANSTYIYHDPSSSSHTRCLQIGTPSGSYNEAQRSKVRDIGFISNTSNANSEVGIWSYKQSFKSMFQSVYVAGFLEYGMQLNDDIGNIDIFNCFIEGDDRTKVGLYVPNANGLNVESLQIHQLDATAATNYCIHIGNATAASLSNCTIEGGGSAADFSENTPVGIYIDGSDFGCSIDNCYFERVVKGVYAKGTSGSELKQIRVTNCKFSGGVEIGVDFDYVDYGVIANNGIQIYTSASVAPLTTTTRRFYRVTSNCSDIRVSNNMFSTGGAGTYPSSAQYDINLAIEGTLATQALDLTGFIGVGQAADTTGGDGSDGVCITVGKDSDHPLIYGDRPTATNGKILVQYSSNVTSTDNVVYKIFSQGTVNNENGTFTSGADYAEYFEWADGNPTNEDRVGVSVVIDNGKIREATAGETPFGIISGNPSYVGNAAPLNWNSKTLRDDFGRVIVNDDNEPQVNPNWDSSVEYIPRSERKEWDMVGLVGRLRVKSDQQIDPNWIFIENVTDQVAEYLVK